MRFGNLKRSKITKTKSTNKLFPDTIGIKGDSKESCRANTTHLKESSGEIAIVVEDEI